MSGARFEQAIARIDSAHAEDPNKERVDGQDFPSELLYAQRMSAMLERFQPDASEALRLAVRCQHLRRWKIPRSDYPMTSEGYQQWRTRLMKYHAELASEILRAAGYDDTLIARVQFLVRKERLKTDPEAQTLEDVTVLVFLENYLTQFVREHSQYDEAKLTNILRRIARKMSQRGREAALTLIKLPPELVPRIRDAIT
ncbi:MAG TPA: DUF4202 domain-containing protein [Burkholderiales bacterium]|nr:DUF4202 domain-containing protein [Burkholderiales bacterium]